MHKNNLIKNNAFWKDVGFLKAKEMYGLYLILHVHIYLEVILFNKFL